jgi:acetyl esterase/lipase
MKRASIAWLGLVLAFAAAAQTEPQYKRTEDVIYGRKFGTALTLDVFEPVNPNGCGVLFMVSGGFYSSHEAINAGFLKPFLERGYTVFAIVHGSQPKFVITEITQDIHRSVRFVRLNAAKYGVDPGKLAITGASAGGHLCLTMATQGKKGDPNAKDPVDRESSEIQCAGCFFPPTDFLNYSEPCEDAVGVGTLKDFKPAFGPRSDTPEERQKLGREISPIYFVHSNMPPILIIHGDADKLVPIYQAKTFIQRCQELGDNAKLIVRTGKDHGWPEIGKDLEVVADWFDENLRGKKLGGNP